MITSFEKLKRFDSRTSGEFLKIENHEKFAQDRCAELSQQKGKNYGYEITSLPLKKGRYIEELYQSTASELPQSLSILIFEQ